MALEVGLVDMHARAEDEPPHVERRAAAGEVGWVAVNELALRPANVVQVLQVLWGKEKQFLLANNLTKQVLVVVIVQRACRGAPADPQIRYLKFYNFFTRELEK